MNSCHNSGEIDDKSRALRYLALGDSYTIGEGVHSDENFPAILASALEAHKQVKIETKIIAKTGWTTGQLNTAIEQTQPDSSYQLVTLLIGVNNQYRGLDKTQYRLEFRELLQKAVAFAGSGATRVVVLSIPDYGVTPFAANMNPQKISDEIDAFNAINFDETQKTDAHYINVTDISRLSADDKSLLVGDSLHPSGKMYQLWVEKILPVAEAVLKVKKTD